MLWDLLSVTEKAAIACYPWIGRGNQNSADNAAVLAMRNALNKLHIDAQIAIGEGERDKAPMLFIGERLGSQENDLKEREMIDLAVDPLEGTSLCANSLPNSITVLAATDKGGFLNAPDVYMQKIAVGQGLPENIVDLDVPVRENIMNLAKAKKCSASDICVTILKRERHSKLIEEIRATGAKIKLIGDGDVLGVIATCLPPYDVDMYIGTGGAPEGVIAAAGMKLLGGQIQGRLLFDDEHSKQRAFNMGILNLDRKYNIDDLAQGDKLVFVATGVTDGFLLEGVKYNNISNSFITNSILIDNRTKTLRKITTKNI